MRPRGLLRWVLLTGAGYILVSIILGIFVCEGALHPRRRLLTTGMEAQARADSSHFNSELTDTSVIAKDGIILRGWLVRPPVRTGSAVILLHGHTDNRFGMWGYAEFLLRNGYTVLLPDARAHGASGGTVASYGLLETDDVHRWVQFLIDSEHPSCVLGLGESMGAAQLLQSLEQEPRFCAVVAESPFASFEEIAYDRMGQAFGAGPWLGRTLLRPVVESAFLYAGWKYGLDLKRVSPEESVAAARVPVLLIHGHVDHNIPIRHSRLVLAHGAASVRLWDVPSTDHTGTINAYPREFESRVIDWFETHSHTLSGHSH